METNVSESFALEGDERSSGGGGMSRTDSRTQFTVILSKYHLHSFSVMVSLNYCVETLRCFKTLQIVIANSSYRLS